MRPRKGDALLFFGLKPDGVTTDVKSLHAGCPVVRGTKWIATKVSEGGVVRGCFFECDGVFLSGQCSRVRGCAARSLLSPSASSSNLPPLSNKLQQPTHPSYTTHSHTRSTQWIRVRHYHDWGSEGPQDGAPDAEAAGGGEQQQQQPQQEPGAGQRDEL